jgi:multidrug efflux pump
MFAATSLAIFFVPVFFVVIRRRFAKAPEHVDNNQPPAAH